MYLNLNVQAATGDNSQEGAGSQENASRDASTRVTRSGITPVVKPDKSRDIKVAGGQKGKGRKRKVDSEGYKLSDYMDNQVCIYVSEMNFVNDRCVTSSYSSYSGPPEEA